MAGTFVKAPRYGFVDNDLHMLRQDAAAGVVVPEVRPCHVEYGWTQSSLPVNAAGCCMYSLCGGASFCHNLLSGWRWQQVLQTYWQADALRNAAWNCLQIGSRWMDEFDRKILMVDGQGHTEQERVTGVPSAGSYLRVEQILHIIKIARTSFHRKWTPLRSL